MVERKERSRSWEEAMRIGDEGGELRLEVELTEQEAEKRFEVSLLDGLSVWLLRSAWWRLPAGTLKVGSSIEGRRGIPGGATKESFFLFSDLSHIRGGIAGGAWNSTTGVSLSCLFRDERRVPAPRLLTLESCGGCTKSSLIFLLGNLSTVGELANAMDSGFGSYPLP